MTPVTEQSVGDTVLLAAPAVWQTGAAPHVKVTADGAAHVEAARGDDGDVRLDVCCVQSERGPCEKGQDQWAARQV